MAESEAKWYVVHTYSGYENKVATDLMTTAENRNLQDMIIDVKVPVEIVTETVGDKTKEPKDYSLGEILRLTEGDLASVPCTSKTHEHCNHMESCPSHPIWQQLDNLINNYLDSVTLANLLNNE